MKEQIQNNGDFIELQGPLYLEIGQNFYDQQPFSIVISKTSESTQIPFVQLRRALSYVAMFEPGVELWDASTSTTSENLARDMQNPNSELMRKMRSYSTTKSSWINNNSSIGELIKGFKILGEYLTHPYWNEYILTQLSGSYDSYGEPNDRVGSHIPTPTYVEWVIEKIRADKNARVWGIEEIFPQDFSGISPSLPDLSLKKPSTQIWRIRRIAETTRKT